MAQASNLPDYPFIFQSGTARVYVAPDIAVIELTVSSGGLDAAKTLGVVNVSVDDIFQLFAKARIAHSDITSSDVKSHQGCRGQGSAYRPIIWPQDRCRHGDIGNAFNLLEYKLTSSETRGYYPAPYIPPSGSVSTIRAPANISLQKSLNVLFKLE